MNFWCGFLVLLMTQLETFVSARTSRSKKPLTDEQRLYKSLMDKYDVNTRPVYNASNPVNVNIGITLTQIFDVDERNQVITTNIWLDLSWKDEKLTWNPDDYNGLKILRMPCTSIWRPDIVLYNSADDYNNGYMEALAMVHNTSDVFWPPIVKLRSSCDIDITYFPFDDQVCKLKMGSWAYDGFQVDLFERDKPVDLSNFVSNGEWKLVGVSAVRNVIVYPCCPEPFPDVTFYIRIRRRTLYYMYNVLVPCFMLSVLTLLGFWMRPDSGEKVTLGLTVLLAFSVFMLLIAENMPATSNFVPLIGIYLTSVMAMTSMSVILAVLASNINHRGLKEVHVPNWLRVLLFILSKLVCMKLRFLKQDKYRVQVQRVASNGDVRDVEMRPLTQNNNMNSNGSEDEFEGSSSDLKKVIQRLDMLIQREKQRDKDDMIIKEWVEAAEVVDRFLFWIFVLGTTAVTLMMLLKAKQDAYRMDAPNLPQSWLYYNDIEW